MTDPIEPEDTDHGVATHEGEEAERGEEAPVTERPSAATSPHPADANDPTAAGLPDLDPEATVNLTGDFDATVNLKGGAVVIPERDDVSVTNEVTRGHLKGLLEALVFASDKPIKAGELAKTATAATKQVKELLEELRTEYAPRGMQLDEVAGGWIFRTNAAYAPFVRDLTKQRPVKLSRAQIETLAILAYRQPITRPEVDEIRGVDCGPVLKVLLERDLVRVLGKKDEPGRPWLYGTTSQFLEFFGLKSLRDLPTLREFTELNEESRRTVEKELGETLEAAEDTGAREAGAGVDAAAEREESARAGDTGEGDVADMASDTLPPEMVAEEFDTGYSTEIPPAASTSDDVEDEASREAPTAKIDSELDPEEEFPDDDDDDFDDDEDEDDEAEAEAEAEADDEAEDDKDE